MKSWAKAASVAAFLCLVSACGGGGGGGDANPTPSVPQTSVTASTAAISASASYAENAPTRTFSLIAANMPDEGGLYVGIEHTSNGLLQVDFQGASETEAIVTVQFRSPVELDAGTVTDTINVEVCRDQLCNQPVRGSPMTVQVSYSVTDPTSASIDTTSLSFSGTTLQTTAPTVSAAITLASPGSNPPIVSASHSYDFIQSVLATNAIGGALRVDVSLRPPNQMTAGVRQESVVVRVCYDYGCTREIRGSPFTLTVTYTTTNDALPEPGLTSVPYLSRAALPHNVLDAEYSGALNAIVTVASEPRNALYLHDVQTGAHVELTLSKKPTSVSIAPDGLRAAVGHDALITYVDLTTVGQAGAPSPILLDVSTSVFDIVLDGRGYVHALPAADQWVAVHSIEIATNTETLGSGSLYAGARGKLHPSGDFLYTANNGLSPSDIAKYDIQSGMATALYDSPYHGDYEMCGDLWFKEDGERIYTKCGNTFRASTTQSEDMVYAGRLQLSTSDFYSYHIASLSQSDATKEIVLLETDWYKCQPFNNPNNCYTHLSLYESEFLNRTAVYSLEPIAFSDGVYQQRGLYVFHSSDGLHRYLISRLQESGQTDVSRQYYLTVLQ